MPISARQARMQGNSLGGEQGGNPVGTGKVSTGTPTRLRPSIPSGSPTSSTAPGWGTTCAAGLQVLRALVGLVQGGLSPQLVPDHARRLADAAGQPAVGAVPGRPPQSAPGPACGGSTRWSGSAYGEPSNPARVGRARGRLVAGAPGDPARARRHAGRAGRGARPGSTATSTASPRRRSGQAAVHRAAAMDLSDSVGSAGGCQPDSPLLPLEHAALVRAYSALLAAVHR